MSTGTTYTASDEQVENVLNAFSRLYPDKIGAAEVRKALTQPIGLYEGYDHQRALGRSSIDGLAHFVKRQLQRQAAQQSTARATRRNRIRKIPVR